MKTLTLEECLSEAMENNVSLQAARKKTEVAGALKGSSIDIPNTSVELIQNSTEGGGMDNGLTFSQDFEFPSVYVARHKVAGAQEKLSREEFNEAANSLKGEVMSAFYSLSFSKARVKLIEDDMRLYSEFAETARVRFEEGESSRLEYLNAKRMLARMETLLEQEMLAVSNFRLTLGRLTGSDNPVEIPSETAPLVEVVAEMSDFNPDATFGYRLSDARLGISEKNVFLARQEFWPGFSVSATSQLLIKGFNPYHIDRERFTKGDFMGFSVGITVPLYFGAKRARLMAARHELDMARLEMEDERIRANAEFNELRNNLQQASIRMNYYTSEGLEQAREIRRLAMVSYELGEIDYLEYMQNIQTSQEIWLEYLETVDNYNQLAIKILTLKGEL